LVVVTATILGKARQGKVLRKDLYFHETGYDPHAAQWEIHRSPARFRACSNGRRWGKTLLAGKEGEVTCFARNRLGNPQRGWIVGPNYDDGEKEFRVIFDSLKLLGVDDLSSKFLKNEENGNMHILTNWGWDCEVRSAAHPESLVGEGLDWVILAEAGRLTRATFTQYIRPALSDKRGWALATGVPEIATDVSLLYWGWTRGQDQDRSAWASWRMPSWTNTIAFPGGRFDPEILDAEEDLTEDEFRRQYGGEFVERVGRVMAEWEDEHHLANLEYQHDWPLYAAVDYGYTNPFVWLWIQVGPFGEINVIGEERWELRDAEDIAKNDLLYNPLLAACQAFYPDPAEPDDTAIISRILKLPARQNTGGELRTRLGMIRQALKIPDPHPQSGFQERPVLQVDRNRCSKLAWEMREGYRWPQHKTEVRNDSELPMDKDNHGPEALGRFFKGYYDAIGREVRRTRQGRVKIRRR
jgi:hypothetical protein